MDLNDHNLLQKYGNLKEILLHKLKSDQVAKQ